MNFPLASRTVWAGIVFITFGVLALWLGPEGRGNATEMAAGYIPTVLGYALFIVGCLLIAQGTRPRRTRIGPGVWRCVRFSCCPRSSRSRCYSSAQV